MALAFVEAPGIDVRNVEFSFGSVSIGQTASVAGKIEVFRSDITKLPRFVFQSESSPYHEIGRADRDGWSVRVGDTPYRYMTYGPYTSALPSGLRMATFRLMVDNNSYNNANLLTLEAFDATTGLVLSSQPLNRGMFKAPYVYQDFNVPFYAVLGHRTELRTLWRGGAYIRQDAVTVR